eukprot:CAMPEP_0175413706 /NCGR_PEP_ID=MMETSP0095-20121207/43289_1 /TAXON_ID=311494 /ORGANISM="Alexandrium monilatum, Strain CCMP3105" /LENGTH=339 /DNA_ID=CAMNT_0016712749 /DNA_START=18 /DNA_END=1036 /DNA_ORIENTATION=+
MAIAGPVPSHEDLALLSDAALQQLQDALRLRNPHACVEVLHLREPGEGLQVCVLGQRAGPSCRLHGEHDLVVKDAFDHLAGRRSAAAGSAARHGLALTEEAGVPDTMSCCMATCAQWVEGKPKAASRSFAKRWAGRLRGMGLAAAGAAPLEVRTDVYLLAGSDGVGAKLRDVDASGNGLLEVKVREDVKKRGAERWRKLSAGGAVGGSGQGLADALGQLLRTAGIAAVPDLQGLPRVRLEKRRWQGLLRGGTVAEQTDLEVAVAIPGSAADDGGLEWRALPLRYRTICFEGAPRQAYSLVGELFGLAEDWEALDLQRALDAASATAEAAHPTAGSAGPV